MKEIGGYFELDQFISNHYHKNMIELNTARNALIYLVKSKKIKKLYIPYYLCDSISNVLDKKSIQYEYYNIDKNFNPIFDKILLKNEYLYIVNYYGQISNDNIILFKNKFHNIILDNTHAFFQNPVLDVDTIYSCRKFFGVPDGAYLYTDSVLREELEIDYSKDRMKHILGRFEGTASDYYNEFNKNDEYFKELPIRSMSKLTKNLLGAIDYVNTIKCRNINFKYLYDNLKNENIIEVQSLKGAFAYPLYTKKSIEIRTELIKEKIYIPTLWPNVVEYSNLDSVEYNYALNILPLPCDQRYNLVDMECMLKKLKIYL